jgi:hypothetical protein
MNNPARPHQRVAFLTLALILAACVSEPQATPSTSPVSTPIVSPLAAPVATPVTSPVATSSAVPSPSPAATPIPSDAPTPTPVSMTADERALVTLLRVDVRTACAPRRTDLPPQATAGIECAIDDALVDRVGAYSFIEASGDIPGAAARDAYLARMASYRVAPNTGDCATGKPGDRSWPTNTMDVGEDGGLGENRSGCFLDEDRHANVRLTCYGPLYVGVVGKSADLAALYRWAWQVAPGEDPRRDPPGLCAAPD